MKSWIPSPKVLLSSALLVLSFPPWNLWPLAWISLVPWLMDLNRAKSLSQRLRSGFWVGYLMSLGGLYWVAFVLMEFGGLSWPLSILGLLLFGIIGQVHFVVFALIFHMFERYSLLGHSCVVHDDSNSRTSSKGKRLTQTTQVLALLTLSLLYAGNDWLVPKQFTDTLGHSVYLAKSLRQLAEIGGAPLITVLIVWVNLTLWYVTEHLIESRSSKTKMTLRSSFEPLYPILGSVVLALLCAWGFGYQRRLSIQKSISAAPQHLQAAAIQGNIGDFEKIASENGSTDAANKVMSTFTRLSDQALSLSPKPQLLIWPETAFPATFHNPHSLIEMQLDDAVDTYVNTRGVPLLFGGYDHDQDKNLKQYDYNALFLLAPGLQADRLQVYRKNILLLFGEYIPGAESFAFIRNLFPQVGNFGRGSGPEVLTLKTQPGQNLDPALKNQTRTDTETQSPEESKSQSIQISPIICYEALYPNYLIASAQKGSQLIINITNDSWFGPWGEPQLHLALSTFRSIETRLPMLRTTNTGISALILPNGEIISPTGVNQEAILNVSIPILKSPATLMKSWGDWFGPASLVLGLLGFILLIQQSKRTPHLELRT